MGRNEGECASVARAIFFFFFAEWVGDGRLAQKDRAKEFKSGY